MRHLKSFEEFVEEGVVKTVTINSERARSLIQESERKLRSLNANLEKVGINVDNASDYVEHCYDLLMFLIRAKLYLVGYSASGQGAHEAEVAYLRNLGINEKEVQFMDQLRYFRNGIIYYGSGLDQEYAEKVINFTKSFHPQLKKICAI
ncbi:MAG: hypothetical protein WCV90_02625 [Candidatus Woesearchaeota archaeon]